MALAAEHYENFPVGSVLVPRHLRHHIHRIYAFARTADDIADELRDPALLAAYRQSFLDHLAGKVRDEIPLHADLALSIEQLNLPVELFTDLLDAFAQDLRQGRYDQEGLFDYCRRSADPVGRLVLLVFGCQQPELAPLSDRICTGLQLVNHLQDIKADYLQRDRIYFPMEDLQRYEVSEADMGAESASPGLRRLVLHWAERCQRMFIEGWPLTLKVPGRLRLELRAIIGGAAAILSGIKAVDGDVLAHRVRTGRIKKFRVLSRAVLSSRMPEGLR